MTTHTHETLVRDVLAIATPAITAAIEAAIEATIAAPVEAKRPKAAPKAKAEAKVTYLRKATRAQFVAASEYDLTGWSTRDIARAVVAGEVPVPDGFAVGEGYRELVS